ncbi:MAG: protein-methionine-sulfoxide reductase catalytic subunit MsrP [Holophagales bacterium]|nr:protein-methionine-sulfoxide reductase catalytic subunit MsrP [Holophagales bacterium]
MTSIHIPPSWRIADRLATPESVFRERRRILRALGLGSLALSLQTVVPTAAGGREEGGGTEDDEALLRPAVGKKYSDRFPAPRSKKYSLGDREITPEKIAAHYSNFYEFTTAKDRVWQLARDYPVVPWKVEVGGLVKKPRTLDLDDIFTRFPLEERLYRFRCVERWAMQVPWVGYPLKSLIDFLEPLSTARWVRLETVMDPEGLPGQRLQGWYPWPYVEALRLDEARHDLAFVAVGSYGHPLPMQHGAPWRVITPWKYGYKSPKSLVRIELTAERPGTFWNELQPAEYGFYSNVEPHKPHPRWSQRWEQDIGTEETRETLLYNGYAEQVASLYDGDEV